MKHPKKPQKITQKKMFIILEVQRNGEEIVSYPKVFD